MCFNAAVSSFLILSLHLSFAKEESSKLSFDDWVQKHRKVYADDFEYQKRLNVYLANTKIVERHNQAYKIGYTSFAMTMESPFSDLTDTEFHSTHLMESQNCSATHTSSGKLQAINDLPEFVDWRTKGVITPIKNQKHCGSCWTFSTTGTLEAHTCLKNPDLDCTTWAGLAEQQLLDCATDFDNHGCNGGLPSHAFEYIKYAGGIDTEQSYPYHATDEGPCRKSPSTFGAHVAEIYNITTGDETDLATAVASVGPVSVAYDVSPDFRFYSHGVYDSFNATTNETMCMSDAMHVNHAVVAVGYGATEVTDETPSVPFYIIRNSWSTSWGMEGYFWIKKGVNLCGISDCASFPIVPALTKAHVKNNLVDIENQMNSRTSLRG